MSKLVGNEVQIVKSSISELGRTSLLTILENELDRITSALYVAEINQDIFRMQGQVMRLQWMIKLFSEK